MRIAVDGYEVVQPVTGVGRVVGNLVPVLGDRLSESELFILMREKAEAFASLPVKQLVVSPDKGYFRWQNGPLKRTLKKIRPDVLVAPNYTLPLFYKGCALLFVHDVSFASYPQWFTAREAFMRKFIVKRSIQRCTAVITDSEFSREEILKHFPIDDQKLRVIYPGVSDCFRRSSMSEIHDWKVRKGLQGKKLIGYLGSIFNRRHIPELVESVKLLRKTIPELCLYIVGRDLTHPSQNIRRLLAQEWIVWEPGMRDVDLPAFYSALEAFAYISEYEGFGLPPLEALACGTVPVLLNRSSLREVYQEISVMVEEAAPGEIAAALETALMDQALREAILERYLDRKSQFSWRGAGEKVAQLLRSCV